MKFKNVLTILFLMITTNLIGVAQVEPAFSKELLPYKNNKPLTQKIQELIKNLQDKSKLRLSAADTDKIAKELSTLQATVKQLETGYTTENLQKAKNVIQNLSLTKYSFIRADDPIFNEVKEIEQLIDKAIKEKDGVVRKMESRDRTGCAPEPVVQALNKVLKTAQSNRIYFDIKILPAKHYKNFLADKKKLYNLIPVVTKKYEKSECQQIKLALSNFNRNIRAIKNALIVLKKETQYKRTIQKMDELSKAIDEALKVLESNVPH